MFLFSGLEFMTSGKWIVIGAMGMSYFWAVGYTTLPLLAYLLPNWSHLQMAITLPAVVLLVISFCVPESPRWLLTRGRISEAESIILKIAKFNERTVPDNLKLRGTVKQDKVR